MLSDSVAQKPTIAVNPGQNTCQTGLADAPRNASEACKTVATEPAVATAQASRPSPIASKNGADQLSSRQIDSIPR